MAILPIFDRFSAVFCIKIAPKQLKMAKNGLDMIGLVYRIAQST